MFNYLHFSICGQFPDYKLTVFRSSDIHKSMVQNSEYGFLGKIYKTTYILLLRPMWHYLII